MTESPACFDKNAPIVHGTNYTLTKVPKLLCTGILVSKPHGHN